MTHLRLLPKIMPMGCGRLLLTLLSPRLPVDILERPMRPQPFSGLTLSLIMSPEVTSSALRDKAGQPGAAQTLPWSRPEVIVRV